MPRLSFMYGNFARFDGHMLGIPEISPEEYEKIVLSDRVLARMGNMANKLATMYHADSAPTIFTAQLTGLQNEYVTLPTGTNVSGIVTDRDLLVGDTVSYWDRIVNRGLTPVIDTTICPHPPIVAEQSPDFTLLGIRFPFEQAGK